MKITINTQYTVMKKLIYTLAFILVAFVGVQAQEIAFEQEIIDYGELSKGADSDRTYTFKNSGDQPLVIKMVKPACGCTVAEYPREPIAPGASGVIKVGYDTQRVGPFNKTIEVLSNAKENGRKILRIKGRVVEQL